VSTTYAKMHSGKVNEGGVDVEMLNLPLN